jgi:hypothetical protein
LRTAAYVLAISKLNDYYLGRGIDIWLFYLWIDWYLTIKYWHDYFVGITNL